MARVRKPQMIRGLTGMNAGGPPSPKGAMLAAGGDNIPAVITDQSGQPQAPAAIKKGEIIFSVEAVIGAGNGDYDHGAEILLQLHEKLKQIGKEMLLKNSLAGAVE